MLDELQGGVISTGHFFHITKFEGFVLEQFFPEYFKVLCVLQLRSGCHPLIIIHERTLFLLNNVERI